MTWMRILKQMRGAEKTAADPLVDSPLKPPGQGSGGTRPLPQGLSALGADFPPGSETPFSILGLNMPGLWYWHLGLALCAAVMAGYLGFSGAALQATLSPVSVLVAAGLGLLMAGRKTPDAAVALLWSWGIGGACASGFAGGTQGPATLFCLLPLAAATVIGGARQVIIGASLSVLAAGLSVLVGLLATAPVQGEASFVLSSFALIVTLLALSAGLVPLLRQPKFSPLALEKAPSLPARVVFRPSPDLEARLEHLAFVLEGQPHLILLLDDTGRVEDLFGTAPSGVTGADLRSGSLLDLTALEGQQALILALHQAQRLGEAEAGFIPLKAPDRFLAIVFRKIGPKRFVAVLRDAVVQHAREAALDAARQAAEEMSQGKTRFLANMSHELRTPLNSILGFSDIMRNQMMGELSERYVDYARMVHESGRHLLDLINDLLDLSKIEAQRYHLSRDVFDARDPITLALKLVRVQAHEAKLHVRAMMPPHPIMVDADPRALRQITLNLISNALKFSPEAGSISVSLFALDGQLVLSVADTGVGIPPEDLKRIGRPYEQAGDALSRAQGTGLGLSLVRALAGLHGGEMTMESQLGEGTVVSVRLPVLTEAAEDTQPNLPLSDPSEPGRA